MSVCGGCEWVMTDVVGIWISQSALQPCWSADMLVKVAKENCPGGLITRKGVLVGHIKCSNPSSDVGVIPRNDQGDQTDPIEDLTSRCCSQCSPDSWCNYCTDPVQ